MLLAIVILANFNIVFLGQSLVATSNSNPLTDEGQPLRPGLFSGGSSSINWHDIGAVWWQWEPAGKMMSHAFLHGRIPLWDSAVGGGVDSHVNMIQTQYYPPYIALLLAGDTPILRDFYYLAQIFVSGLFCYLLLLRNGCHTLSAICMGAVFMLSGSMTQNVNSSFGQSVAVLPLMVWATDWVLRRPTWRIAGCSAFVLALAASSSFLPAVISGYVLCGLYAAVALTWRPTNTDLAQRRTLWSSGIKALIALSLSILLLAFLLIPVELASQQDQTFSHWYRALGAQHFALDQMLALLSPSVSFDVLQVNGSNAQLFTPPPIPSPFYIGLIPILIAFIAFGRMPQEFRRLRAFFAIATALLFLKLIGASPVQWIALLPVFRQIHFIPYSCGALTFGFAGLTALGIESLIHRRSRLTLGIGCCSLFVLALCIVRFDQIESLNPALQGPALWSALAHYGLELVRLAVLAVGFLVVLILRSRYLNGYIAALLLLALICCDLISLDARPRFLRADVWEDPPAFARLLQADRSKFRVHGPSEILAANVSQALGVDVLSSRMAFNSSRYTDIIRAYFNPPGLPYPVTRSVIPESRAILNILNVKYLVLHAADPIQQQRATEAGLIAMELAGHYRVFRNPQVWPRAYLAKVPGEVRNPEQQLKELAALRPGEVLLEEQPRTTRTLTGESGSVSDLRYDFDRITARIHANQPALLVLDENYSPGWHATVSGKPVSIYHANYAFQAVEVPQGDSEVRFRYFPPGLAIGIGVSVITAVAAGFLCLAPKLR